MKKLFTLLFFFAAATAFAQAPGIQWQKTLGGSLADYGGSVRQTRDGGYIMAGSSSSSDGDVPGNKGNADLWVVKTDGANTIQWAKNYGGSAKDGDAVMVDLTADGGYVVVATTGSASPSGPNPLPPIDGDVTNNRGDKDYWVLKLDSNGALQWQKCLGGRYDDAGTSIHQTTDSGYIVCGYTSSDNGDVAGGGFHAGSADAWVVKLNDTGMVEWGKCLGGGNLDYGREARQTADGGYIVACLTASADGDVTGNHGGYEAWVVKLSSGGAMQWQKCLGGTGTDDAYGILQANDGGYVMAGKTASSDGDVTFNHGNGTDDYWVVKLDNTGNTIQWQRTFGGSSSEAARGIQKVPSGGYVVTGYSLSNDGDVTGHHGGTNKNDYWILKLNSSGNLVWQTSLGGTDDDYAYAIEPTTGGGFIAGGYTYSTDGDVASRHTDAEYWMVKLNPDPTAVSNINTPETFFLSPNPATTEVRIQTSEPIRAVLLTDISGKVVFRGGNITVIPTAALANGLYFVRVQTTNGMTTQKVLVQH